MTAIEIIVLNFQEIRRRSTKLWNGVPGNYYGWKPDEEAMTCLEMVRHVLEGEHLYHMLINTRGNLGDYPSPWNGQPFTNLQNELDLSSS